ncbi:Hypothetical predicted protein, partial [Mytilus galloprovincialis]
TSEVFQLETKEPLIKPFCELCDYKDKIMKALYEQIDIYVKINKRNTINLQAEKRMLADLQAEKRKLADLQAEKRKLEGLLIHSQPNDDFMIREPEVMKTLSKDRRKIRNVRLELSDMFDSSSKKTLCECSHCYEMEVIIIQLDRRLCEIRRRIIEAKGQSFFMYDIRVNKAFEDLLKITDQNTSITSIEEKGRMKDKELKSDRSSQDSKLISDVDVRDPETKSNQTLMESQASQGRRPELDQTEEKSDLSLRISEIRREYASNYYTKTDEQKGLGIIVRGERSRYVRHDIDHDTTHLEEFFDEIGFIVKRTEEINLRHYLKYMTDGQFYCVFIVFCGDHGDKGYNEYLIEQLLLQRDKGIPLIIMSDFTVDFPDIRENNEDIEILIVNRIRQRIRGSYRHPKYKNIFDDFMKVTRSNRLADIIDILTRINSLYDYPVITFQSTLRKKLSFL